MKRMEPMTQEASINNDASGKDERNQPPKQANKNAEKLKFQCNPCKLITKNFRRRSWQD